MPEWLTRRDDSPSAWTVSVGAAARGEAWTNRVERMMRVPDGTDPLSRVIRAHEMMHAKVSPLIVDPTPFGLSTDVILAAEEYRVNLLVGEAGFDLEVLADGSEKRSGKYMAEHRKWNELVIAMAASAGTKSASELLAGVKSVDEDMAAALREVEKSIVRHWYKAVGRQRGISKWERERAAAKIGSTKNVKVGGVDFPEGYIDFTIPLAKTLQSFLVNEGDEGDGTESNEDVQAPTAEQVKRDRKGDDPILKFWPAQIADLPLTKRVNGNIGKRRVAANMGRNPRRIHRLLVDPQRRIFDNVAKGNGGIVVVDTSGSMRLEQADLQKILEAAPGCVVISYGVRSRIRMCDNIWILADRGKVCGELPNQSGLTNGSDGPAVRLGAQKRRGSEPFIWITDGHIHNGSYLTDHEMFSKNLMQECAGLIVKHGIHQVETIDEAVTALKNPSGLRMKWLPRFNGFMPRG